MARGAFRIKPIRVYTDGGPHPNFHPIARPFVNTQDATSAQAEELLRRAGLTPLQVQSAGHGSHHHLFVVEIAGEDLLLLRLPRYAHSNRSVRTLLRETEAIRRVRPFLPVPHPVILLPDEERAEGSLMPILRGRRGTELLADRMSSRDAVGIARELGKLLADLHRVQREEDEPSHIGPLFEDLPQERNLLHGDAHLGNLLVERRDEDQAKWSITGIIDWSFTHWGPPEADLVEMAICEAEPRPAVGRAFYEAYLKAGALPPREPLFRRALIRELERRLQYHAQSHDPAARDVWTHWLTQLRRPGAVSTRVFDTGRTPARGLS
jgi:aminoglycoside phosphotransferase (APT) family kinase protein